MSMAVPEPHVHPAVIWVSKLFEGVVVNVEVRDVCTAGLGDGGDTLNAIGVLTNCHTLA